MNADFKNRKPGQYTAEDDSPISEVSSKSEDELRKLLSAHVVVI